MLKGQNWQWWLMVKKETIRLEKREGHQFNPQTDRMSPDGESEKATFVPDYYRHLGVLEQSPFITLTPPLQLLNG